MSEPYRKGPIPYFHEVNDILSFNGAEHFKGLDELISIYREQILHQRRAWGSLQGIDLGEVAWFRFDNVLVKKDFIEDAETGEDKTESRSL